MGAAVGIDGLPQLALSVLLALSRVSLETAEDPLLFVTLMLVLCRRAFESRDYERLDGAEDLFGGYGGSCGGNSYCGGGETTQQSECENQRVEMHRDGVGIQGSW